MKKFKTEKIVLFNAKNVSRIGPDTIISKPKETYVNKFICQKENFPQNFLNKKICRFRVDKYYSFSQDQTERQKEGRWTLKEHIQYLQALEQFGLNWKKISKLIPTRTTIQIRSHSQKFYKRLKECKDIELGIDFTSKYIKNVNDMIAQIKLANKDYNIVNVFLYLSEKCYPNKNPEKGNKANNMNINNILKEKIDININNDSNASLSNNDIKDNTIDKKMSTNGQIINNNINNVPINNIFINNINFFNGINDTSPLIQFYLNKSTNSNCENNNMSLQNNSSNNMNLLNYFYNNNNSKSFLDNFSILDYPINNF